MAISHRVSWTTSLPIFNHFQWRTQDFSMGVGTWELIKKIKNTSSKIQFFFMLSSLIIVDSSMISLNVGLKFKSAFSWSSSNAHRIIVISDNTFNISSCLFCNDILSFNVYVKPVTGNNNKTTIKVLKMLYS